MKLQEIELARGRHLIVASLSDPLPDTSGWGRFVVMLPAFDSSEVSLAQEVTEYLIELGCAEFCCVGPEAELLHDSIDDLVERRGLLEIVTTEDSDEGAACEYFVHAAGRRASKLLALVAEHAPLCARLVAEARS